MFFRFQLPRYRLAAAPYRTFGLPKGSYGLGGDLGDAFSRIGRRLRRCQAAKMLSSNLITMRKA